MSSEVELLGHKAGFFLIVFREPPITFSIVAAPAAACLPILHRVSSSPRPHQYLFVDLSMTAFLIGVR